MTLTSATADLVNKENKALGTEMTVGAKTVFWVKCGNVQAGEKALGPWFSGS